MKNFNASNFKAFTLIELMIVVTMIGVLATVAFPTFEAYVKRSKTQEVYMMLPKLAEAQVAYFHQHGSFLEVGPVNIPPSGGTYKPTFDGNWKKIAYETSSELRYGYRGYFLGDDFIVEAQGDLDGDGDVSIFNITLNAVGGNQDVIRSGIIQFDELE